MNREKSFCKLFEAMLPLFLFLSISLTIFIVLFCSCPALGASGDEYLALLKKIVSVKDMPPGFRSESESASPNRLEASIHFKGKHPFFITVKLEKLKYGSKVGYDNSINHYSRSTGKNDREVLLFSDLGLGEHSIHGSWDWVGDPRKKWSILGKSMSQTIQIFWTDYELRLNMAWYNHREVNAFSDEAAAKFLRNLASKVFNRLVDQSGRPSPNFRVSIRHYHPFGQKPPPGRQPGDVVATVTDSHGKPLAGKEVIFYCEPSKPSRPGEPQEDLENLPGMTMHGHMFAFRMPSFSWNSSPLARRHFREAGVGFSSDRFAAASTDARGEAVWNYLQDGSLNNLALGASLLALSRESAAPKVAGTLHAAIMSFPHTHQKALDESPTVEARGSIRLEFTHIARLTSTMQIRSARSTVNLQANRRGWGGVAEVTAYRLPLDLQLGDAILLGQEDTVHIEWLSGVKMVAAVKEDRLQEGQFAKLIIGATTADHLEGLVAGRINWLAGLKVETALAASGLLIGICTSHPAAAVGLAIPAALTIGYKASDHYYNPLVIMLRSKILLDFGREITIHTLEGQATLRQPGKDESVDVATGSKTTVTAQGAIAKPSAFHRSDLSGTAILVADTLDKIAPSVSEPTKPFDIPELKAVVTGVKFFETGIPMVPYGQREYRGQFDRKSSRSIGWELDLEHPAPGRRIDFQIDAAWYTPEGRELHRSTVSTFSEGTWSNSKHYAGWGWKEPGNWRPGVYRVEFFHNGRKIAGDTFEIIDRTLKEYDIPSIRARVTGVKFYEGGFDIVPYNQRVYREVFPQSSTRYIFWELNLEHPDPGRKTDFSVEAVFYKPDRSVLTRQTNNTTIQPTWTKSYHFMGWGWQKAGNWTPGVYSLKLFVDGKEVGGGTFEIAGK